MTDTDDRPDSYTTTHPVAESLSCPVHGVRMSGDWLGEDVRELWDLMHRECVQ